MIARPQLIRFLSSITVALFTATLCFCDSAWSCPLIGGLVDFNCDGQHKIVVAGDSVVKGIGDKENKNNGGYVLRVQKKFRKSIVVNLGKPGYTSDRLLSEFKTQLNKTRDNAIKRAFVDADIVIIDAGRNDFFVGHEAPATVKNLSLLAKLFGDYAREKNDGQVPFIRIATLIPTTRGFQRPFVDAINELLIEFNSEMLPIGLYFNKLSTDIISVDGVHPFSRGYTTIAKYVIAVLKGSIKTESLALRPDGDFDGIYDMFEENFKTNPQKLDTDLDSLSDGEEIFEFGTNPRSLDSDADGISDGAEIAAGSNPNIVDG